MAKRETITDSSSLLTAIQSVINDEYKEIVHTYYKLIETKNVGDSSKCSELEIHSNISNFSFTLDKIVSCSCSVELEPVRVLRKSAPYVNKKNDLIILCPSDDDGLKINAYIFELKSKNIGDASTQILAGKVLVEYIVDLLKIGFNLTTELKINFYGVLASLAIPQPHMPSNIRAIEYNFNRMNRNGINIPILHWHANNKFYLRDLHSKIIDNRNINFS